MIYAVIEEIRFESMKTNHAGNRETYDTEKEYNLKFAGNPELCKQYREKFRQYALKHDCFWRWNKTENRMCSDSYLSKQFHCYCALMSSFLAEEEFTPAF